MSTHASRGHNTDPNPNRYVRNVAKVAALALAASGAVAAYESLAHDRNATVASSTRHPGSHKHHKPETRPAAGPLRIEQLPGYGQQVTPEQRKTLQAATVQVVRLKKDPGTGFSVETFSTGTLVNIGGEVFVATVEHGLVDGGQNTNTAPEVIPESESGKINIWAIGPDGKPDAAHPIPVDKAVGLGRPDVALLHIDQNSPAASRLDSAAIDYVPGLLDQPEPGTEVNLYSAPGMGSNFRPINGVWLGTGTYPGSPGTMGWAVVPRGDIVEGNSGATAAVGETGLSGPEVEIIKNYKAPSIEARLGVIPDKSQQLIAFSVPTQADIDSLAQLATAP